jgi:hypothetical protein
MSLSHRNGRPIERKKFTPPAIGWKCPTCGKKALIRVNKAFLLEEDGVVMPKLDRLQCQACHEDFFDLYAMDKIAAFRRRHPLKKANGREVKKAVAA